jgi:hypothetical protein
MESTGAYFARTSLVSYICSLFTFLLDNMGRGGHGGKNKGRGSGRKMYIANVEELALREGQIEEQREARRARRGESDDEEEDSGDDDNDNEESGGKEAAGGSVFKFEGGEKAPAGGSGKTKPPNAANDPKIAPKMMKLKDLKTMGDALPQVDPEAGMTRKQREALDAEKKHEEYLKRRMAGETPEARKDLERLKEIRAKREAQKKMREEAGRAPGWKPDSDGSGSEDSGSDSDEDSDSDSDEEANKAAKAKKAAAKKVEKGAREQPVSLGAMSKEKAAEKKKAAAAPADNGGDLPLLKAIDIKKMNPNELKEHLKARNLSIQGAKKDLAKRLQDFDTAREKETA